VCDKASFSFKATTRKKKKKQQKGRDDGVGSKEGVECRVDRVE
jgi:ribosomal protein L19E